MCARVQTKIMQPNKNMNIFFFQTCYIFLRIKIKIQKMFKFSYNTLRASPPPPLSKYIMLPLTQSLKYAPGE